MNVVDWKSAPIAPNCTCGAAKMILAFAAYQGFGMWAKLYSN